MRLFATIGIALLCGAAIAQKPFDWKEKWHGQTVAVEIISRGEALKGKHFDSKVNRLYENPWNAIQTLLGSYMVARLDEASRLKIGTQRLERLAVQSCAGIMTMLSTHQQLYEGHVVYQLDDWRNGDKLWREVWDAPMLAQAIFHPSEEQTRALVELCGFEKRVLIEPSYAGYEPEPRTNDFELRFKQPKSAKEMRTLIDRAMPILTEQQRKEAKAIVERFETRFDAILRG